MIFFFSCAGGSVFDILEEDTHIQPGASASSQGNDELLRNTGGNQINNGNLMQESLPVSNDRKDELLRPGGRTQDSNGNLVQESLPAGQQNEQKLLITSTKEESLTIEKSKTDLKSDVEGPGSVSSMKFTDFTEKQCYFHSRCINFFSFSFRGNFQFLTGPTRKKCFHFVLYLKKEKDLFFFVD